ncbi:hypothetical protein L208DRAFT_1495760 [Tricholoma matsutake]|nr:hypothetical protein L208DRAFT_1495760 [Tricholoma matsutake 945]
MLKDYTRILEMFEALQVISNSNKTLQKCWHVFESQVKKGVKLFHLAAEAAASRFHMLLVLIGSSVNEDGGLGAYHCTPGLVFDDIFLGDDDIIACKTCAQHYVAAWNHSTAKQTLYPPSESSDEAGVGIGPLDNNSPIENKDKISTTKIDEKRNIIKGAMLKGFVDLSCPLRPNGGSKVVTLPWTNLHKILSERSVYIEGWPEDVTFPNETKKVSGTSQGVKDLPAGAVKLLLGAFKDPHLQPRFYKGNKEALISGMLPIIIGAAPHPKSGWGKGHRLFANGTSD